jgi:hypothetical protein
VALTGKRAQLEEEVRRLMADTRKQVEENLRLKREIVKVGEEEVETERLLLDLVRQRASERTKIQIDTAALDTETFRNVRERLLGLVPAEEMERRVDFFLKTWGRMSRQIGETAAFNRARILFDKLFDSFEEFAEFVDDPKLVEQLRELFGKQTQTDVQNVVSFVFDLVDGLDVLDNQILSNLNRIAALSLGLGDLIKVLKDSKSSAAEMDSAAKELALSIAGIGASVGNIVGGTAGSAISGLFTGAGAGFQFGGLPGAAIGGGVGLLTGLFSSIFGGGSAAAKAFNEEMEVTLTLLREDSDALQEIANELDNITTILGENLLGVLRELDASLRPLENLGIDRLFRINEEGKIKGFGDKLDDDEIRFLEDQFDRLNIKFTDLSKAAQAMGIDIGEFIKVMITGEGDRELALSQMRVFFELIGELPEPLQEVVEGLDDAVDSFDAAADRLKKIGDTLDRLDFELEFGVKTVGETFKGATRELIKLIPQATGLLDLDIRSAAGREAAQKLLTQLASIISTSDILGGQGLSLAGVSADSGQIVDSINALPGLTEEERDAAKEILRTLKSLLGQAESDSADTQRSRTETRRREVTPPGTTAKDFERIGSITIEELARSIAELETQTFLLSHIDQVLTRAFGTGVPFGAGLVPPSTSSLFGIAGVSAADQSLNLQLGLNIQLAFNPDGSVNVGSLAEQITPLIAAQIAEALKASGQLGIIN